MIQMAINPEKYREYLKEGVFHIKSKAPKFRESLASKDNRETILRFDEEMTANNMKNPTRTNYLVYLHRFAEHMKDKDLSKATKSDVISFVTSLKNEGLMNSSINSVKSRLKTFYIWLNNRKKTPACVSWIKRDRTKRKIDPNEILSEDEVRSMIEKADNQRDKAIIMTLYETGTRIDEFMNIKFKDMFFDKYGVRIKVDGKTGERVIRIVNSIPYLREWMKIHPLSKNPEAYLWINFSKTQPKKIGQQLKYNGHSQILKRAAKLAGISKKIHPHILRHSRASFLAGKVTEPYLRKVMGWTDDSNMVEVYVHLNDRNVDDAVLSKVYGVHLDHLEELNDKLVPKTCYNCGEKNIIDVDFCTKCHYPLDINEVKNREKMLMGLITPDMIDKMIEKRFEQMLLEKMGGTKV